MQLRVILSVGPLAIFPQPPPPPPSLPPPSLLWTMNGQCDRNTDSAANSARPGLNQNHDIVPSFIQLELRYPHKAEPTLGMFSTNFFVSLTSFTDIFGNA